MGALGLGVQEVDVVSGDSVSSGEGVQVSRSGLVPVKSYRVSS